MKNVIRLALAAATAAALGVGAQQAPKDGTIAKLVDLNGNVLVSRDAGLVSGNEALRLQPNTRVITTANSRVIVEYDDGCRVELKENQRFEVERGKPCALLVATSIIAPTTGAAPLLVGAGLAVAAGTGAGVAAVGVLVDQRGGSTVSPN